jgi:hypothetical protein
MDLVAGVKKIIVVMEHVSKNGDPKFIPECTLPLTGKNVVDMIITDLAVFQRPDHDSPYKLVELAPGVSADEAVAKGSQWDLVKAGGRMRGLRVLTVNARYGIGERNRPVTAAMKSSGAQVTAIAMDTDHSFSDHRIALSSAIVNWLDSLRH